MLLVKEQYFYCPDSKSHLFHSSVMGVQYYLVLETMLVKFKIFFVVVGVQ